MHFFQLERLTQKEIIPGCKARFIHSENMTFAYWEIDAGASLPEHSHPNEQVLTLLDGTFELTITGETKVIESNSIVVIPPNVIHSGKAIAACKIIDVFHPVREDYRT